MIYCKDCRRIYFVYRKAPEIVEVLAHEKDGYFFTHTRPSLYRYVCTQSETHAIEFVKEFDKLGYAATIELQRLRSHKMYIQLDELSASDLIFVHKILKLGDLYEI